MISNIQRKANRGYRKIATGVYTWVLLYLGALWLASVFDWQGFAIGLMWLVGLIVLPVAWLQPTNLVLLSIAEWLNRRDSEQKWDTIRVGVLIFICVMSAGGLSILLSIIGAGMAYPSVIPMIFLIVACMVYAGEVNTAKWMKVLAVLAVFLAVFLTIKVMPFGGWSRGVYESTGYSVDVSPNKADVAARKAFVENKRRADLATERCILDWKQTHMAENQVIREDELGKAIDTCKAKFSSPTSYKGGGDGNNIFGWSMAFLGGTALLHWLFVILGIGGASFLGYKLVKKSNTTSTPAKTVSSSSSWVSKNKELLAFIAVIVIGYYTMDSWMPHVRPLIRAAEESKARLHADDPIRFFVATDQVTKSAYVVEPGVYSFSDQSLSIRIGEHAGRNPLTTLPDYLNGGMNQNVALVSGNRVYFILRDVAGKMCADQKEKDTYDCPGSYTVDGSTAGAYHLRFLRNGVRAIVLQPYSSTAPKTVLEMR